MCIQITVLTAGREHTGAQRDVQHLLSLLRNDVLSLNYLNTVTCTVHYLFLKIFNRLKMFQLGFYTTMLQLHYNTTKQYLKGIFFPCEATCPAPPGSEIKAFLFWLCHAPLPVSNYLCFSVCSFQLSQHLFFSTVFVS